MNIAQFILREWSEAYGLELNSATSMRCSPCSARIRLSKPSQTKRKLRFYRDIFKVQRVVEMYKDLAAQSHEDPGPFRSALSRLVETFDGEKVPGHIAAVALVVAERLEIETEKAMVEIVRFEAMAGFLLAASEAVSAEPKVRDERRTRSRRKRTEAETICASLDRVGVKVMRTGRDSYGGEGDVGLALATHIAKYTSGEDITPDGFRKRLARAAGQFKVENS
jgi:hypothetical protein